MSFEKTSIKQRLDQLEKHLSEENPALIDAVKSFRQLDKVGHKTGLLAEDDSFATRITWWPLISVLGTFSAGKSTFINHYIGEQIQRSGNQAVDDKFTVLCYSHEAAPHALPGVALDSDPRFPLYRISEDIESVATGEGKRIDSYLQMKTTTCETLRGKTIIDSPGFDADAQRTSTLRITDHIITLSDLVLVLFDARHPEPGAMRDTLDHLVSNTINRPDAGKFLYILNQIDTAAREDNPEEVIAAWQRALGERGLTAGRFYTIYSPDAAVPIEDAQLRQRFESKRDKDLLEIHSRMDQVGIERAYRIVASLDHTAREIEQKAMPSLVELMRRWYKRTLVLDAVTVAFLLLLYIGVSLGIGFNPLDIAPAIAGNCILSASIAVVLLAIIHFGMRELAAKTLLGAARKASEALDGKLDLVGAFRKSTRMMRIIISRRPAGWGSFTRKRLKRVREENDRIVQMLNDRFTNPSGAGQAADTVTETNTQPEPVSEKLEVQEKDESMEFKLDEILETENREKDK
ncbi:dynamin family protein [Solemya velum gill symbiont]|uniref:dynamin family protein n=1 Tax=Solemya velum gill symbiont TaxID=2340 RepID=UPI000996B3CD|nr:dynamin family protein [Solemya velum gill symbiont]OOZ13305.1 dynamin family protein [Solemya velum gill symbiont]OOZ16676.1 dynamin family protein [Solemya velum gill symbiont]OOZ18514.1 dynamin family protein [Solemya velum gill symbiont]OOZ21267.1 dynamin family protein [Solemya velum gill symbiont]OOZ22996.1 dynamin family protein [Solemya velum gill symbiont]